MKKGILFIVVIALMVLPLIIGCAAPSPAPKPAPSPAPAPTPVPAQSFKLTYSNFFPPTHKNSILAQQFCDEIKKQTNGAVDITYYPGGTLTPAPKIYDGVVSGISDIGMSALTYTVGRFPASEIVDLPHEYPNGWTATWLTNDFYKQFKPKELDDTKVLYFHGHGPGVILSTKKAVSTLEDLKGMVLRSTGVGAQIVEALGAKGYAAAQGDAYELMSKGTIDGSFTPPEVLKGWKQAEVVKFVTNCYKVGNTTDFFVVMNNAKWNSLPDNFKAIITKVSEEWIEKHAKVWSYYDKAGVDYFLTFPDRKVINLSDAESAKWTAAVGQLIDGFVKDKTAKGLPAADYKKYITERVKYLAAKAPSDKECVDWVEKNLPDPK
jgi:TRAP-type C4-dicarboxylate transport system substrate-binding protein